MSGRKMNYKRLSVAQKLQIIERLSCGETVIKLALEYGIGETTVRDIRKSREKLLKSDDGKFVQLTTHGSLDEAVLAWIDEKRKEGISISDAMCLEQAHKLYKRLGLAGKFKDAPGWMTKFKRQYGCELEPAVKKTKSVRVKEFIEELKELIQKEGLKLEQIYNTDESRFYWQPPNSDGDTPETEEITGRATIMPCVNASGDHKLKLLVIGETEENEELEDVRYYGSTSAGAEVSVFSDWFYRHFVKEVASYLTEKNLPVKAVLLLDNSRRHPAESALREGDIYVRFIPAGVALHMQPMDRGILSTVKRIFLESLKDEGPNRNSTMYVVGKLGNAWNKISQVTIVQSWRRFLPSNSDLVLGEQDDNTNGTDSRKRKRRRAKGDTESEKIEKEGVIAVKQITRPAMENVNVITENVKVITENIKGCEQDIEGWLKSDDPEHVMVKEEDEEEIMNISSSDGSDIDEEEPEDSTDEDAVTVEQAAAAVEILIMYVESSTQFGYADLECLRRIRTTIEKQEPDK